MAQWRRCSAYHPLAPRFYSHLGPHLCKAAQLSLSRARHTCYAVTNVGDVCFACPRRLPRRHVAVRLRDEDRAGNRSECGTAQKSRRRSCAGFLAVEMNSGRQLVGAITGICAPSLRAPFPPSRYGMAPSRHGIVSIAGERAHAARGQRETPAGWVGSSYRAGRPRGMRAGRPGVPQSAGASPPCVHRA